MASAVANCLNRTYTHEDINHRTSERLSDQWYRFKRGEKNIDMTEAISFRAGKCDYDEESKICTPKQMKGEIQIKPSEEAQGFFDFQWSTKDRVSGSAVEPIEFILIPGETKWIDIKSAKNGRVLCLLFSTGEKWFFWLQEKHQGNESLNEWSEKDKELLAKLQKLLEFEEEQEEEEEVKEQEQEQEPEKMEIDRQDNEQPKADSNP